MSRIETFLSFKLVFALLGAEGHHVVYVSLHAAWCPQCVRGSICGSCTLDLHDGATRTMEHLGLVGMG